MKKIIVAGAGHGGLVAAYILGEKGYDVTVIEKQSRDEAGYDWDDCIWYPILEKAGIIADDPEYIEEFYHYTYFNPAKTVGLNVDETDISSLRSIDRRYLLKLLFDKCGQAGVKLVFNTEITGAKSDKKGVTGVKTTDGDYDADLVIDAAGMDSPVRKSLPVQSGVRKELREDRMIWTYRAYYENTGDYDKENPPRAIYFFHNYRAGMDWLITFENYVDILVGSFSPLTDEDIEKAVSDFRVDHPYMGEKVLRGGTINKIPLGTSIAKFVWNGYAAIGDSASMIEPMSGSGMTNSIRAGMILADAVIAAGDDFSQEKLWKYEYDYMTECGNGTAGDCILRDYMAGLKGEDIDYFFEHKLITSDELGFKSVKIKNPLQAIQKLVAFIPESKLLPGLADVAKRNASARKAKAVLPEKYDRFSFEYWRKIYDRI